MPDNYRTPRTRPGNSDSPDDENSSRPEYFDELTSHAEYHERIAEVTDEIHGLLADIDRDIGVASHQIRGSVEMASVIEIHVSDTVTESVHELLTHSSVKVDETEYNPKTRHITFELTIRIE